MTEVFVVETIKALNGKARELKQALIDIVPLSRAGNGCLQYDLFESNDKVTFLILMRYKSAQDLTNHENSDYINNFVQKYEGVLYGEVTLSSWKSISEK